MMGWSPESSRELQSTLELLPLLWLLQKLWELWRAPEHSGVHTGFADEGY